MTLEEAGRFILNQQVASLGFIGEDNHPGIRRVFSTWHKGMGTHLISTNTSSMHVRAIRKNPKACLYFDDCDSFQAVCLTGEAILHFDHEHRAQLWHEGDEKYYSKGVDDEDYCVIAFKATGGRFYRFDGMGDITAEELTVFDRDAVMKDYAK